MDTFVSSVAGVAFYQTIVPFYPDESVAPDWFLGLLFGMGGMARMYLGARCQKFMPAGAIKGMPAGIVFFHDFEIYRRLFWLLGRFDLFPLFCDSTLPIDFLRPSVYKDDETNSQMMITLM